MSFIWAVFSGWVFAFFIILTFCIWQASRLGIKAFSMSICGVCSSWWDGADIIPKKFRLSLLFHCIPLALAVVFSQMSYFWIHHMFESMIAMILVTIFIVEDINITGHECFCEDRYEFAVIALSITWVIIGIEVISWMSLKYMKIFKDNTYQICFDLFMNSLEVKELNFGGDKDDDSADFNKTKFGETTSNHPKENDDEDEPRPHIHKKTESIGLKSDEIKKSVENKGQFRVHDDKANEQSVDLEQMEFVIDTVMNAQFMKDTSI